MQCGSVYIHFSLYLAFVMLTYVFLAYSLSIVSVLRYPHRFASLHGPSSLSTLIHVLTLVSFKPAQTDDRRNVKVDSR